MSGYRAYTSGSTFALERPPNGVRISRRKRELHSQNRRDLAREAVGCMRVFGGGRFGFCYAWKQMRISLSQGPEKMEYCFVDLVRRLHVGHVPCTCDDDFLCILNVLRENIRHRQQVWHIVVSNDDQYWCSDVAQSMDCGWLDASPRIRIHEMPS